MARPIPTFNGFCGQRHITHALETYCKGATAQSQALPHFLLAGQSGIGKTRLARAIAKQMGSVCHEVYCTGETRRRHLVETMSVLSKADILFMDEVHALSADCQELLYPAIDNLTIPKFDPETKRITEGEKVTIPSFTVIAASDQCGRLCKAFKRRMVQTFTLAEYSVDEMRLIVNNYAADLKLLLKPQAATRIAEAARGLPRKARHLMELLKLGLADLQAEVTKADVVGCLNLHGIDESNLNANDRRYLAFLGRRGGRVSLQNIGTALGLDLKMVTQDIEGYLVKQGLVGIDGRGRSLTDTGRALVMEKGIK